LVKFEIVSKFILVPRILLGLMMGIFDEFGEGKVIAVYIGTLAVAASLAWAFVPRHPVTASSNITGKQTGSFDLGVFKDYAIRKVFVEPKLGTHLAVLQSLLTSVPDTSAFVVEIKNGKVTKIIPARMPAFNASTFTVEYDDRKIEYNAVIGSRLILSNKSALPLSPYQGDPRDIYRIMGMPMIRSPGQRGYCVVFTERQISCTPG
jgi:hypothetical protein